ncbi:MAG: hypothetical protein ACRDSJ_19945 [Rubrobacteraceae bacterium]
MTANAPVASSKATTLALLSGASPANRALTKDQFSEVFIGG